VRRIPAPDQSASSACAVTPIILPPMEVVG
jgi:hypothetical protein